MAASVEKSTNVNSANQRPLKNTPYTLFATGVSSLDDIIKNAINRGYFSDAATMTPEQIKANTWYDEYGKQVKYNANNKDEYSLYSSNGLVQYNFKNGQLISATPSKGFKKSEETKTDNNTTTEKQPVYNVINADYTMPNTNNAQTNALIKQLQAELEELKNPKPLTVEQAAEKWLSLDAIDEAKVLADYNDKTNQYYNELIDENNRLRTDNIRNNNDFYSQAIDNYLDSYKYVAPTALRRATKSANTLATDLQSAYNLSQNDYGLYQNNLNFEAYRKKELEENPWLAKQQVNNLRTTLTGLSANEYASEVKKKAAEVNAYATRWSGARNTQALAAQGIANRYSGLTQAATSLAGSAANAYGADKLSTLYNYYYNLYGQQKGATSTLNTTGSVANS